MQLYTFSTVKLYQKLMHWSAYKFPTTSIWILSVYSVNSIYDVNVFVSVFITSSLLIVSSLPTISLNLTGRYFSTLVAKNSIYVTIFEFDKISGCREISLSSCWRVCWQLEFFQSDAQRYQFHNNLLPRPHFTFDP